MDTASSFEAHARSKASRGLPDGVGESTKPHKKSPALALFDEILEKTLQSFAAESRAPATASDEQSRVIGGVVGWAPLLRALNVRPGRGLLGMSRNSHESVGVAEDYFQIPPEACTAMKVKLGAHHVDDLRRGGKKTGKVVHFGGDCEPDVMATELLRGDGYDTFIVEPLTAFKMPPYRRDAYVKFYANEAQRLAIWLTGKPVDETKLSQEIRARNAILAKFQEMMRLRLHNPFYVPLARVTQINQLSNNA
jgi:hypothetical protein